MLDPSADNTDGYAFAAPGAEDAITIASNWIPGQVPANGPNFFRFDDRARYYNNIDNNGDGVADIKYRYTFDTEVRNPNSFLTAGPNTTDYDGLNLIQTYDVTREEYLGLIERKTAVLFAGCCETAAGSASSCHRASRSITGAATCGARCSIGAQSTRSSGSRIASACSRSIAASRFCSSPRRGAGRRRARHALRRRERALARPDRP